MSTTNKKPCSIGNNKFRLPYCTLRRILLNKQNPFWTYCECQSPVCPSQKPNPRGAIYVSKNGYPYEREVWITEAEQYKLWYEQTKLAYFCLHQLDPAHPDLPDEYGYPNLPLCVVDAVFSMRARYEATINVVNRVRSEVSHLREEPTIEDLIGKYDGFDMQYMAETFSIIGIPHQPEMAY